MANKPPPRPIKIIGGIGIVPLTQGYEAIIDAADAPLVGQYNWQVHVNPRAKTQYAVRGVWVDGRTTTQKMHRLIMGEPDGMFIDHVNQSGLDNRKSNLRLCSAAENQWNTGVSARNKSGFRGVDFHELTQKWQARVTKNGKRQYIGCFDTQAEAVLAHQQAAMQLHGEFYPTGE
jgi:hypothetical protein